MSCWPVISHTTAAAAAMFSRLSATLNKLVCGISPPPTTLDNDDGGFRAGLGSLFLLSPSPERAAAPRRSSSSSSSRGGGRTEPPEYEDGDEAVTLSSSPAAEETTTALPCLAFPSQDGYRVFSLADGSAYSDGYVRLRVAPGRRLLPSPRGGAVLATEVCYRHPCRLVDPFSGEVVAALPDLPVPLSETEPVPCARDEPRPRSTVATDDGLAWDWSPRGVMVARGDTAFFFDHGGGGRWAPVHRSRRGSHMTVNHRGGLFFLLEMRSLRTTVIDAATLRGRAVIPPPPGVGDIDGAYLAPSAGGEVLILVHRAGDGRGTFFTEAYRARLNSRRRPARWARVEDVGDRAVFIDGAHGFTVAAGALALRNHVYVAFEVTDTSGRGRAVEYDVGVVCLRKPERQERMNLDLGDVERMWGQPYWIIPKDALERREDQ